MKRKKHIFLGASLLLLTTACTNDNAAQDYMPGTEPGTESLTAFVIEDNEPTTKAATTRTTGNYDGSIVNFYWTADDPLWVNKAATGTPDLQRSKKSDIDERLEESPITGGVKRASRASFYFEGTFSADQYTVRYTGKNGTKDKVTIKNEQTQTVPNDASHIGESGDCGVAIARKASNRYNFMLDHKASYMVFLPYNTPGAIAGARLTKIKVTADKAIAGEFDFNDSGIDISSRPATSADNSSITLNLSDKFTVPDQAKKEANAAIMVIAPGTYGTFKIEYTLSDPVTAVSGTITKTYANVTLKEGKRKQVSMNLQIPLYGSDNYYMWDAAENKHYWAGYEDYQPITNNGYDNHYPSEANDPRWFNPTYISSSAPSVAASRSCANTPNINECLWYTMKGKPYWDNTTLWAMKGHLYNCGMWFKKLGVIAQENGKPDAAALKDSYNNRDYRSMGFGASLPENNSISTGVPDEIEKYFFLPAMGVFTDGRLSSFGTAGFYWLSTADRYIRSRAHNLYFTSDKAIVSNIRNRKSGCYLWKVE
ncbi:hypothetical protein C7120_07475 [Prevotella sp. oral taxon 376]|uniref:hypothetical protein n=1 Tax=Prevotella sp. oral taxon 376 TaxID=712466 RepID=UPI000D1DDEE4|nr:hypothetical protein [Prevotella sp. oral taxon 376]PTL34360.1 hypothetical protein C7120_07475 [Prevotella sp. oral taxon 376]